MTFVPTLVVKRFWTEYKKDKNDASKLIPEDMVAYGPMGSTDRTLAHALVRHLSCVRFDAPADDQAANMAKMRWQIIGPQYEAWKAGQELPETGTPLAAWNGVSPEQAEVLKARGIRSVEDVSHLTDTHVQNLNFPGVRDLIKSAKLFLSSADTTRVAAEIKKRDDEVDTLKAQNAELAAQMAELTKVVKRGPGRPRKEEAVA